MRKYRYRATTVFNWIAKGFILVAVLLAIFLIVVATVFLLRLIFY